jgi:hypothetical protein
MFVTGGGVGEVDGDSAGVVVAGVVGAVVAALVGVASVCPLEQAAATRRRTTASARTLVRRWMGLECSCVAICAGLPPDGP